MSGSMIEIDTSDKGKRTGYLSQPANANGRGIVLLFEVYGLHDDMKKVADIYAENGYTVLVPDLFWKKGEGIVFSYDERQAGADLFNEIGGFWSYLEDVDPAIAALKKRVDGPIALIGIGLGGITAYTAAAQGKADAAVSFFPAMLDASLAEGFSTPWLYHYAEEDKIAKPGVFEDVSKAFESNDKVRIESYPGAGHGFIGAGRAEYDAATAKAAHGNTLEFLDRALG
jgi:carboxymethylenebutenolidase